MPRGGARERAGRPKGTGKFSEQTKAVRLPISEIDRVMSAIQKKKYQLPFYQYSVSAGFPSPAEDDIQEKLDLNDLLIKHPAATYFLRVSGISMTGAGIHHNDILVVDRSIEPSHGKIVIASVNGELTVKRLSIQNKIVQLVAENKAYPPIVITADMDLHIWGVVTNVIHTV